MFRASRVIAVGLLGLGACANGVVDELPFEPDPNAAGTTSNAGTGGSLGSGGTFGSGGTLGSGGSVAGSAGSSSPFGGSAGVTSGGGAGMAGSGGSAGGAGGSSGAFGTGGSSGAFGTGGSAGKASGGSGGTGANCVGLPTYPAEASAVDFPAGTEIQHKGIRYRVVIAEGIEWANSECAPDIAMNWCDDEPDSGQWWEVVGPC